MKTLEYDFMVFFINPNPIVFYKENVEIIFLFVAYVYLTSFFIVEFNCIGYQILQNLMNLRFIDIYIWEICFYY